MNQNGYLTWWYAGTYPISDSDVLPAQHNQSGYKTAEIRLRSELMIRWYDFIRVCHQSS